MTTKLKTVEHFDDLPNAVKEAYYEANTEDIIQRYDNDEYRNYDILHNTLADFGYKLKD